MQKSFSALLVFTLCSVIAAAQLKVKINGKQVTEQQVFTLAEIKKLEFSFANPKKIPAYSQGKTVLNAQVISTKTSKELGEFYLVKNGSMAMNDFLSDANASWLLYEEGGTNNLFTAAVGLNNPKVFRDFLQNEALVPENNQVSITVSLYYKDRIGYEKYGDPVELVKPLSFKINTGNADGSIAIKGTPFKIPATILDEISYRDQYTDEMNTYKGLNPLLTDEKIYRCRLDKFKMSVHINIVDTKEKTADQKIEELQKGFGDFLVRISNECNPQVVKKYQDVVTDHWIKLVSYGNTVTGSALLDKKANSDFDKEPVMKPWQQGNIRGYKFSSLFRVNYCQLKPADRSVDGYAVVYLVINTVNPKQVLFIWERSNDEEATEEILPKVEAVMEKFITGLKYN